MAIRCIIKCKACSTHYDESHALLTKCPYCPMDSQWGMWWEVVEIDVPIDRYILMLQNNFQLTAA